MEYAEDMVAFQQDEDFVTIVDPSAASFKLELRNKGLYVKDGDNDVMNGIRACASMFNQKHIHINRQECQGLIEELQSYRWDEKAALVGNERPIKSEDHGCLTKNTLIDTPKGKIRIKDLVGKTGKCYAINQETQRKCIGTFKDVRKTGHKECFRIKLKNGKIIEATADHPILTNNGWKRVDELTKNDKVVKINYVN